MPSSVYWRRRAVVLVVAFVLVFGFGKLLGGGSDGRSDAGAELTAGQQTQPGQPVTSGSTPGRTPTGVVRTRSAKPTPTPLAQPDGPCSPSEVTVRPRVVDAEAGRDVQVALAFTSTDSEACTFRVSHESLAVKIVSGSDFIWSSQQCPRSVEARDIVVRRTTTTWVALTWPGRRSDETCSRQTEFVRPGYYHVLAAALGGTATDQQFELRYPTRPTVTVTVHPTQRPTRTTGPTSSSTTGSTTKASGQPTGVAEPNKVD